MPLNDFHKEVNELILKHLHGEMVKEYVAGSGKEDEHPPFEINIEKAHTWVKIMRKLMDPAETDELSARTFAWMYNEGMASQYFKAVVMHSKKMSLQNFTYKNY